MGLGIRIDSFSLKRRAVLDTLVEKNRGDSECLKEKHLQLLF